MAKPSKPVIAPPKPDRFIALAMGGIMLLAVGLRLYNLGGPCLWADEFLTVSIASEPLGGIASAVKNAEQTPPLLHYFMHFWLMVDATSEFMIRLPFALCGIGTVWMMFKLGSAIYARREGAIAALLMAVSAFQISYSQEARVYAPLILMALVSSYAFVMMIQEGGRKHQIAYVLATAVLYWLHLHSVFIVAAQQAAWIYLWLQSRKTDKQGDGFKLSPKVWIVCSLLPLALFAPWMPTVLFWVKKAKGADFWIAPMTAGFVPYVYSLYAGSGVMLVILLALDGLGIVKTPQRWKGVFLIALLTIPVLVPYGISLLVRPLFVHRYGIATAIGLYLLAARGCTALPGNGARLIVILLLVGISGINVYPELRDGPPNKPDVRSAGQFVLKEAGRGDVILLNSYSIGVIVSYIGTDTTQYRMTYEAKDIPSTSGVEPRTRMWVISVRGLDGKYAEAYKELANKLGWRAEETRHFHGARVDRFGRK